MDSKSAGLHSKIVLSSIFQRINKNMLGKKEIQDPQYKEISCALEKRCQVSEQRLNRSFV